MQLTLPRYAQTGTWDVDLQLQDNAGNNRVISSADTVEQTGAGDVTAPSLVSINAPASVNASGASQPVQITLNVTDDLSGATCVFVTLSGPSNQLIQNGCAVLDTGSNLNGNYTMQLTIPRFAESGTWDVDLQLQDGAGNNRVVSGATTITVG